MEALRQDDPRRFGRFTALARFHEGASAVRYVARDTASGEVALITAARPELAAVPAYRRRFQAEAEKRRALAVAQEQEFVATAQQNRAKVIEAEAQIPLAMAEAFRAGHLGIMDYYKMRNVMADTAMRECARPWVAPYSDALRIGANRFWAKRLLLPPPIPTEPGPDGDGDGAPPTLPLRKRVVASEKSALRSRSCSCSRSKSNKPAALNAFAVRGPSHCGPSTPLPPPALRSSAPPSSPSPRLLPLATCTLALLPGRAIASPRLGAGKRSCTLMLRLRWRAVASGSRGAGTRSPDASVTRSEGVRWRMRATLPGLLLVSNDGRPESKEGRKCGSCSYAGAVSEGDSASGAPPAEELY